MTFGGTTLYGWKFMGSSHNKAFQSWNSEMLRVTWFPMFGPHPYLVLGSARQKRQQELVRGSSAGFTQCLKPTFWVWLITSIYWLVVWEHFLFLPILGITIPTDFHFSEGWLNHQLVFLALYPLLLYNPINYWWLSHYNAITWHGIYVWWFWEWD